MKVAICEDISIVAKIVKGIVEEFDESFDVFTYDSGENLIKDFMNFPTQYDCFFIDIDLPKINGVEVAKKIRKQNPTAFLVFLTSHSEYMAEVFRYHTFDYLVKPVEKKEIFRVLKNIIQILDNRKSIFHFSFNKIQYSLPMMNIVYFEKKGRKVRIVTEDDECFFYANSDSLIENLNNNFVRVHNSFVVNCSFIVGFGATFVVIRMKNSDIEIPVSRKFRETTKHKLIEVSKILG